MDAEGMVPGGPQPLQSVLGTARERSCCKGVKPLLFAQSFPKASCVTQSRSQNLVNGIQEAPLLPSTDLWPCIFPLNSPALFQLSRTLCPLQNFQALPQGMLYLHVPLTSSFPSLNLHSVDAFCTSFLAAHLKSQCHPFCSLHPLLLLFLSLWTITI